MTNELTNNPDFMNFARDVKSILEQDDSVSAYLEASEEQRVEIALAYAQAAVKRRDRVTTRLLTNTTDRESFRKVIHSLLAEQQ